MNSHQNQINNKSSLILKTCQWVYSRSKFVKIRQQKLDSLISKLSYDPLNNFFEDLPQEPEKILEFLFVLDSLNFCFWPLEGFQFFNLAKDIRRYLKNEHALSKLKIINDKQLIEKMFDGQQICLASDRASILNLLAQVIENKYNGSFTKLIQGAEKSAIKLLQILIKEFIFFQDHAIYEGHQIHFYKRAQLLIRHIYGIFEGKGLGEFYDIDKITIFPDYRIPQVLYTFQIFEYDQELTKKIENKTQLQSGSQQQLQIRAATVVVAEIIKERLKNQGKIINSVQLDWALWFYGQSNLNNLKPHHRTLTIYY